MRRVSIVLPVYNASATVARTIGAILSQDMGEFELIVCDDGSSDDSLEICRALLADDVRAHLIMRGHGGVSTARNAGLCYASCEYVAFVDADDAPAPNWLSTLLELVEGADMAVCGYEVLGADGAVEYDTLQRVPAERTIISADEFTCDLFSNRLMYQGYIWNKLFRRDIIEAGDAPLRFKRGTTYNEDRLFVYGYLKRCKTVAVAGVPRYSYRASAPRTGYSSAFATEISAFDEMAMDLKERIKDDERLADALHYLGKDTFRAVVELYDAAHRAGNPDEFWLAERAADLSGFQDEYAEYPREFRDLIPLALGR